MMSDRHKLLNWVLLIVGVIVVTLMLLGILPDEGVAGWSISGGFMALVAIDLSLRKTKRNSDNS